MNSYIQIAGFQSLEELNFIAQSGVDTIGCPLRLTVNTEDCTEEEAADWIRQSPCPVVLISYLRKADEWIELADRLGTEWIQIHGPMPSDELIQLRTAKPTWTIWKSLVIRPNSTWAEIQATLRAYEPYVDGWITDTFVPETGAEGATGQTHDWTISKRIVQSTPRPVMLAGGLNPSNVEEAILAVRPAGVDVHTGVEAENGFKDKDLTREFIRRARNAFQRLNL